MVKTACLVLLLGFCVPVIAQQHATLPVLSSADSTYKQLLSNPVVYQILIDSLNNPCTPLKEVNGVQGSGVIIEDIWLFKKNDNG